MAEFPAPNASGSDAGSISPTPPASAGLLAYALDGLRTVPGLTLVGSPKERAGAISLVLDDCRVEDVGAALNREGIAVRAGHHCAQPILLRFGLEATVRPSLAFYNNRADIDALVAALLRLTRRKPISSLP